MIAGVDTAFFLLAVVLSFLLLRRLFDTRLAVMVSAMLILCDRLWEFALTGLPQMLMLLLFSGAVYLLARAIEAHEAKRNPLAWLIACAFLFGLLGLTHAMTFFIFGACVLFVALYFRPWWLAPVIMVSIVVLMYLPWMIRNYHVCGSPFGVAYMALFDGMRGSEDTIMRSFGTDFGGIQPYFYRNKLITGFIDQTNNIFGYYGGLIVAPFFLMSLMHNFRRRETQMLKWAVLMMWLGGVFGMCLFGAKALPLNPNDLHLLFIPLFTGFGLAFLLVLWSRLEITFNLARLGFLAVLYIVSLMPMENELLGTEKNKVHWPPYVPPFISILREWSNSDDIIASDMPWAVGWYADRKSLWLPTKMSDLINLHDYEQLHGPIIGIYLTPITGNLPFVSDVLRGEYADWAPLILRQVNFRDFPFNAVTPLPLENQCVFYADHDRWTKRSD
jgi:4-amino-4-deoxy-L-arabinose transferase-like glycosyltransferase